MLVPGCPIDSENASRPKPRGGLSEIGLVIVHSGLDLDLSLPSVRTIVVQSAILIPRWVLSLGTTLSARPDSMSFFCRDRRRRT